MGLGKVLIDEMEMIGRRRGMDKAMLTCLKSESDCGSRVTSQSQSYEATSRVSLSLVHPYNSSAQLYHMFSSHHRQLWTVANCGGLPR
jgi:hypothetical protein